MYAIRSYYAFDLLRHRRDPPVEFDNIVFLSDKMGIGEVVGDRHEGDAEAQKDHDDGESEKKISGFFIRITSYNVCYTKLLR